MDTAEPNQAAKDKKYIEIQALGRAIWGEGWLGHLEDARAILEARDANAAEPVPLSVQEKQLLMTGAVNHYGTKAHLFMPLIEQEYRKAKRKAEEMAGAAKKAKPPLTDNERKVWLRAQKAKKRARKAAKRQAANTPPTP